MGIERAVNKQREPGRESISCPRCAGDLKFNTPRLSPPSMRCSACDWLGGLDEVSFSRKHFDSRKENLTCHCGTPEGSIHHEGFDLERCPVCGDQAITCRCIYTGEDYDPEMTSRSKELLIENFT